MIKDLKKISYTNLKNLISSIKKFDDELSELDSHCVQLWENPKITALEESVVNYLDDLIGGDEVSYFIYETDFGKNRDKENNPYKIKLNKVEYPITDFDSWYSYLLEEEKDDSK